MKPAKPRRFDAAPLLTLKILSRDGVVMRVKDKPLKSYKDLEELLEALKHKL